MSIAQQEPMAASGRSLRVALLGYGAIGREVASALMAGRLQGLTLVGVHARRPAEDSVLPWRSTLDDLLDSGPDLLVEAAATEALAEAIEPALARGVSVVALSIAALANAELEDRVRKALARDQGPRLMIPSGAIAGLDAIAAAREDGLEQVMLIQRKPARALMPVEEADALTTPRTLTDGSAREAALRHPRTSNVAAALALAGLGFDQTRVQVIADPAVTRNSLEVRARGRFGELEMKLFNRPSVNPQTSELTIMSLFSALRRRSSSIVLPV